MGSVARIPQGIGGWFTEKNVPAAEHIDIGVHALDSAWLLMGTPRPVSVSAQVYRNFEHLVRDPVFDVEDAAFAFIRFEKVRWCISRLPGRGICPTTFRRVFFGRELTIRSFTEPRNHAAEAAHTF